MDLNYLLRRHQISLMRAEGAACIEAAHVHRALARGYADKVRDLQQRLGAGSALPAAA